ncbi:MAG: hypothetical protein Kow0065_18430 [Methylomicrobium sp.]
MDRFTDAYEKARDVVKTQKFVDEWQKYLQDEVKVKELLNADGPDLAHANGLDKLRKKLDDASRNAVVAFFVGGGLGDKIVEASKNTASAGKLEDRVATLKMLYHLYLASKRGGQDVWVYSPPKAYTKWIYDEIKTPEKDMAAKAGKTTEVYSAGERKIMCDALLLALNWSMNVVAKLGSPDDNTKKMVRKWFADQNTTDQQITDAIATLKAGFQKIANVANSNKLIFSDEPLDRNKGGWKDWAFVYKSEKMEVVYLQGAFLKSANSGKLWMCALTIIHELSHRAVDTKDHRYDNDGLKPSTGGLSYQKALENADTWAYFATDLAGKLSASDSGKVWV